MELTVIYTGIEWALPFSGSLLFLVCCLHGHNLCLENGFTLFAGCLLVCCRGGGARSLPLPGIITLTPTCCRGDHYPYPYLLQRGSLPLPLPAQGDHYPYPYLLQGDHYPYPYLLQGDHYPYPCYLLQGDHYPIPTCYREIITLIPAICYRGIITLSLPAQGGTKA